MPESLNSMLDFYHLILVIFLYSIVDPDGNVIFELHKWEIDDAHKDKQKMYHENFKVSDVCHLIMICECDLKLLKQNSKSW